MLTYNFPVTTHNSLVITSKVSYVFIKSIYTLDSMNNKVVLLDRPIELTSVYDKVGITYDTIKSNVIYFDIDSNLNATDLLTISVTTSLYKNRGSYISNSYSCVTGKEAQVVLGYDPVDNIYVDCSIDVKYFDKYGNIKLQDVIPLIGNEDGIIVKEYALRDTSFRLPLPVDSASDVTIFTQNSLIDPSNYSLQDPQTVIFDSRNIGSFIVLFVPSFYNSGEDFEVSKSLFINKNNILKHYDRDITKMEYKFLINTFNLEKDSVDKTIAIKKLGVVIY